MGNSSGKSRVSDHIAFEVYCRPYDYHVLIFLCKFQCNKFILSHSRLFIFLFHCWAGKHSIMGRLQMNKSWDIVSTVSRRYLRALYRVCQTSPTPPIPNIVVHAATPLSSPMDSFGGPTFTRYGRQEIIDYFGFDFIICSSAVTVNPLAEWSSIELSKWKKNNSLVQIGIFTREVFCNSISRVKSVPNH